MLSRVRDCFLAGACGDALGYGVLFSDDLHDSVEIREGWNYGDGSYRRSCRSVGRHPDEYLHGPGHHPSSGEELRLRGHGEGDLPLLFAVVLWP